ncbi:MAG TPA: protein kinase, partial [Gemmatimonadaceae bacterium]|nr:protein kinase [Gemmatimonadaceae bacterium]
MQLLERLRANLGDAYEIEGELAGGGMARVFLARDRSLNRRVVIKTLAAEPDTPVDAERFRREIRLAASLQQANIVPVLSTGEIDGVPYYTMPFVDGESLRSRLEALGALPVREAIGILRDVARALAFAHDHNVVHRDIKPENVLLSGNTAVVTDFGIARALDAARMTGGRPLDDATANPNRLTVVGTALGTPAYMSPEQASSDPSVDHRADIYAFGVLAYELLSGAPPFTAATVPALLAAHLARQPVPLAERAPHAPPELVALVMQCLEKEPGARPQSGRDLLAALDAGPVPDAVPARRTPASEKPSIAVLPFANLSPDPADEYFADGVTDEIITDLSALHGLHVIARASMMRFRKTTKDPATVARELNVRYVLDGSVRRAASTLRLTMRLLDTASNATIWSEKIGGSVEDVFAMQEKVSRTVVDALRVTMSPREDRRLTARAIDVRAYDAYLQARQYMWTFTVESLDRARHFLEHALATLGENARLVGTLGEVHLRYAEAGQQRPRDHLCEAERCAHRLAALDDESALLHSLRGQIHYLRGEIREAIDAFERARALEPNDANTACFLALMYGMAGRDAPAREAAETAASLDPLTPLFQCMPGVCEFFSGHPDTALVFYRRFREMDPANPFAHLFVAWTTAHTGRRLEAATLAEHLARDFPGTVAADLAHALARALAGDVQGTRAAITPALYAAADDAEMYARGLMEIMALIGDAEGAAEA